MRSSLFAAAFALAALAGAPAAFAQAPSLQPGSKVQLAPDLGHRTVREVMVSQGGGGLTVIYDMPEGSTQSQRVLRLENVNGMLEVIHDRSAPTTSTATGGTPRLVAKGGGMYSVEYDKR